MNVRTLNCVSVLLLCLVSLVVQGCSKAKESPQSAENQANSELNSQETATERCRKKLAAAIVRVAPASLAMQDRPERAINGLNSWIASCAAEEVDELELSDATIAMIGDSARASSRRFTVNDARYIRDCLLLRDLSNALFTRLESSNGSGTNDIDRVQTVFDWLVRNVSLLSSDESRIPLGAFDVLMTGRGTVNDRAWLFAEALRQQQIDAIIVRTSADAEEGHSLASAPWLVAVLLEGENFLLDPLTGLRVHQAPPNGDEASVPVTLASLQDHERWKDSTVEVIAQLPAFSPRMLVLQEQLAADDAAILYEELTGGTSDILPLQTRILTAGGELWSKEDLAVWSYPESQVIAANALTEQQQKQFTDIMRPFDGPFQRKAYQSESLEELTTVPEALEKSEREAMVQQRLLQDYKKILESSEDMFGKPSRQLLKTRLEQISGKTDTSVIQQLQQVRISSMQESTSVRIPDLIQQRDGLPEVIKVPFPNVILEVNQSTTGDSLYWTAMCQMDRAEFGAAITTLMNYRRQYPDGKWKYPSMINHALCLVEQNRLEDAQALLKDANQEDNPERQRVVQLSNELSR